MAKITHSLILAAMLATGSAAAVSAGTLGQLNASGDVSPNALRQLIAGTGLSADQAASMTLDEIVAIRWQDD